MSYSGTWQNNGYDQNQASTTYQYNQGDQYNQHNQYNQPNQYNQNTGYDQNNQYNQHNQYDQHNQYNQQPNQWDQHNQYNQSNHSTQYDQTNHYDQNNQYNHQNSYQTPPPAPQYQPVTGQHDYNQQHQQQSQWTVGPQVNHYDHKHSHYNNQIAAPQQYVAAHAPMAPPTAVQTFGNHNNHFQYSDLHGKRRALLIGCNYFGSKAELRGCINDVHNIRDFLTQTHGFQTQNMWIMTDDLQDARSRPTRANIIEGMRWLTAGAKAGDNLFLQFSGHGGPIKDIDGDEDDGYDEAIFPIDHDQIKNGPGYIVDDLIHDLCVKPLPQGCRLTAIFDCCHSGSIMDLPYMYSTKGVLKEPSFLKDTGSGLMGMTSAYNKGDMGSMLASGAGMLKKAVRHTNGHYKKVRAAKTSAADVICFSGCKDVQTSADASILGQKQGAMSHAFRTSLQRYQGKLTYVQLLNAMRQVVSEGGYPQKPQLTCCHPLDLDLNFTL